MVNFNFYLAYHFFLSFSPMATATLQAPIDDIIG